MKSFEYPMDEYPFVVGDRVYHIKDPSWTGEVIHIDRNLPHPTTCVIRWDDEEYEDSICWTNKFLRIEE